MTVEVRPLGVKCNIACKYCYQEPMRSDKLPQRGYDLAAIKEALLEHGKPFAMFGGEPLLTPIADLRDLFEWGYERFGKNSLQTNGTLITPTHIEMFRQFNVSVGISIDGPGDLNAPRWAGSAANTRRLTERALLSITNLLDAGIRPSLITTLHKANAVPDRLPSLLEWYRNLDEIGVRSVRIHILEIESEEIREELALNDEVCISALEQLEALQRTELKSLKFDLFDEISNLLLGQDDRVSCVWRACDPYTTGAVQGVEGFGHSSNCGRTNKSGVDFLKARDADYSRYLALYNTPFESGGCKGCRFFLMCKGQCPGTAIQQDWRNRSDQCRVWYAMFAKIEQRLAREGNLPISISPNRREIEADMIIAWTARNNPTISTIIGRRNHISKRSASV